VAGAGLVIGVFFVVVGVTPWEFIAELYHPAPKLDYIRLVSGRNFILGLAYGCHSYGRGEPTHVSDTPGAIR